MPSWMNLSFQDSASPYMEHITFFHDHAMIILILVTTLTLYLTVTLSKGSMFNKYVSEGQSIETIWTILPGLLLIFIAFPSLKTLYLMEDSRNPNLTIKSIGHQWYWSYEYTSLNETETESFMENSKLFRLLKTMEILEIPCNTLVRNLVTSYDVIHSWTIPAMGCKVDALPGRMNQTFLISKRVGLFTGQCSEICGMNHSFMPILLLVKSPEEFTKKINN